MGAVNKIQQVLDGASDYFKRTSNIIIYWIMSRVRGQLDQERECWKKALFLQRGSDSLDAYFSTTSRLKPAHAGNSPM
jgi:hypothetical protein